MSQPLKTFICYAREDHSVKESLRKHLAASGLAKQKWPEEVRSVDELPRTPSGKIMKAALRDLLRAEADR